jgi:hypothetical protein
MLLRLDKLPEAARSALDKHVSQAARSALGKHVSQAARSALDKQLRVLVLCSLCVPCFAAERFSGDAGLRPVKTQTSADQRFALNAAVQPAATARSSADGRFAINAGLDAPETTCGPLSENIFRNGFE